MNRLQASHLNVGEPQERYKGASGIKEAYELNTSGVSQKERQTYGVPVAVGQVHNRQIRIHKSAGIKCPMFLICLPLFRFQIRSIVCLPMHRIRKIQALEQYGVYLMEDEKEMIKGRPLMLNFTSAKTIK